MHTGFSFFFDVHYEMFTHLQILKEDTNIHRERERERERGLKRFFFLFFFLGQIIT